MSKFIATKLTTSLDEESGELSVRFSVTPSSKMAARMTAKEFKETKGELVVEVKERKSSRSLRQNNMLWGLISKIADEQSGEHTDTVTMEIYCQLLQEANAAYEWLLTTADRRELQKSFRAVQEYGEREVTAKNGETIKMKVYKCFVGSSKFDTKEMTTLIDCALRYCDELGITDSEIELARRGEY